VQPVINLAMVEIVVVDKLAVELPLLLEQRHCRLVEHIAGCSLSVDRVIHIIVGLVPQDFPRIYMLSGRASHSPDGSASPYRVTNGFRGARFRVSEPGTIFSYSDHKWLQRRMFV